MTALVSRRPLVLVRVYAGKWVIDCPVCCGAQIVALGYRCVDCHTELEPSWPTDEVRYGVERLLSMRPIFHTRNWSPGETLHDLLAENVEHGIGPGVGEQMMITNDTIERDSIAAGRVPQIGA